MKDTEASRAALSAYETPYEGATPMLLVDMEDAAAVGRLRLGGELDVVGPERPLELGHEHGRAAGENTLAGLRFRLHEASFQMP